MFSFTPRINERSKEIENIVALNVDSQSTKHLVADRLIKSKKDHQEKVRHQKELKE